MNYWAKIYIVEAYFRQKSIHAAQLQLKERFGWREFPVHSMIYRWVNKFRTHGTVHNLNRKDTNRHSHSGRPKSSRTAHNVAAVRDCCPQPKQVCASAKSGTICPGAWQVLDNTWSTERGRQGPPVFPAGWYHPPLLKQIIGMATAALPWPTDQPQVWPAVVVVIHRTWIPQMFICVDTLRTGCMTKTPRLSLTWRQQSQQQSERSQGRNVGGSSRTLPAGSKCPCSAGELIWSTFFERQWNEEFL